MPKLLLPSSLLFPFKYGTLLQSYANKAAETEGASCCQRFVSSRCIDFTSLLFRPDIPKLPTEPRTCAYDTYKKHIGAEGGLTYALATVLLRTEQPANCKQRHNDPLLTNHSAKLQAKTNTKWHGTWT